MSDLISRAEAIKVLKSNYDLLERATLRTDRARRDEISAMMAKIMSLPSAEPKIGRDCTDFVLWLLDEVMDEEMWELNAVANGEIICRKMKKLGLLEDKDGYYIRPSADRASGEWKYLHGSIGSYMTISCPFCGVTFNNVAEWEYSFCPNCGARMKGYER